MSARALVNVVIPVRNLWETTRQCLRSLAERAPAGLIRVTAVDDASTDETRQALEPEGRALFGERFAALRQKEGRGFSAACNLGAAASEATFTFFLNNDTLLTPGFLEPLLAAFANEAGETLGAAGPLLLYPDSGRVQHLGIAFNPDLSVEHLYEHFPAGHPAVGRSRPLQALTGAALLVPAALFARCGGFFEGYLNGFEDLDLCRALRQAGKRLTLVPDSRVFHYAGSTPGRFDHATRNAALLESRWPGGFEADLHRLARADGFEPELTEALDLFWRAPKAREPELFAQLEAAQGPLDQTGQPPEQDAQDAQDAVQALCALTEAEPLFEPGYAALAEAQVAAGQAGQALETLSLRAVFFPTPANLRALMSLAARAGATELAGDCARKLALAKAAASDRAALAEKARQAASRLADEDPELAGLYQTRATGAA